MQHYTEMHDGLSFKKVDIKNVSLPSLLTVNMNSS